MATQFQCQYASAHHQTCNSLAENAATDIKSIYSNDFNIHSQLIFKSRISLLGIRIRFAAYNISTVFDASMGAN